MSTFFFTYATHYMIMMWSLSLFVLNKWIDVCILCASVSANVFVTLWIWFEFSDVHLFGSLSLTLFFQTHTQSLSAHLIRTMYANALQIDGLNFRTHFIMHRRSMLLVYVFFFSFLIHTLANSLSLSLFCWIHFCKLFEWIMVLRDSSIYIFQQKSIQRTLNN